MSVFVSNRQRRHTYLGALLLLALAALAFFVAQNKLSWVGGEIAPAKLAWLAYALLFWYVIPLLVVLDERTSTALRRLHGLFLANMLVRAIVELIMLYVTFSWHPYYGIAHDVFCVVLLLIFVVRSRATERLDQVLRQNFLVMIVMFIVEIGFAWYMANNFVTHGADALYFVPDNEAHREVIAATSGAVIALTAYLWWFSKRWLHAPE